MVSALYSGAEWGRTAVNSRIVTGQQTRGMGNHLPQSNGRLEFCRIPLNQEFLRNEYLGSSKNTSSATTFSTATERHTRFTGDEPPKENEADG